jgi:hypothetical protein
MASNEALERKTVIAGPTMLGIEAGWEAAHPEDESLPYPVLFTTEVSEGSFTSVVGITIEDYVPKATQPSKSGQEIIEVDIIGDAVEVSSDNLKEATPLGRVAVLNYKPEVGTGILVLNPDRAATKEE